MMCALRDVWFWVPSMSSIVSKWPRVYCDHGHECPACREKCRLDWAGSESLRVSLFQVSKIVIMFNCASYRRISLQQPAEE